MRIGQSPLAAIVTVILNNSCREDTIDAHARTNEYYFFCHMLGELPWEHRTCGFGGS